MSPEHAAPDDPSSPDEMISHTAEYALRAMVYIGSHPDLPLTTQQIAAATRTPPGYLSKVLQLLGKGKLVHSQRGFHGGFVLARPLEKVTILDVVNAVDPLRRLDHCPMGDPTHDPRLCPLHQRLDDAIRVVEKSFAETTLAQLLRDPTTPDRPSCLEEIARR